MLNRKLPGRGECFRQSSAKLVFTSFTDDSLTSANRKAQRAADSFWHYHLEIASTVDSASAAALVIALVAGKVNVVVVIPSSDVFKRSTN